MSARGIKLAVPLSVLALALVPAQPALGAPPANDDFPGTTLSGLPTSATGTNVGASKEIDEPVHGGISGGASVWYSWTAPASGLVVIDTCGSDFDTVLAVYTGASMNALSTVASNSNSQGCPGFFQSLVTFAATAGTTYRVAVDGYGGETGSINLDVSPTPANDNFPGTTLNGMPISVMGTNLGASKETGEPYHAGHEGGASVWYSWTAPSSGQVVIDTCESNFNTLLAVYTGDAVNALSTVASNDNGCVNQSQLGFAATAGTTYRIAVDGQLGQAGNVDLDISSPTGQIAPTHAGYIAQVDPICQSFVEPVGDAARSFGRNLKRLFRLATSGTLRAFVKQNSRTARSLKRLAQIETSLTSQIGAVPVPAVDAGTVATWLNHRRQADAFASSAASALKKLNAKRFFRLLDRAAKEEAAGLKAISGFGFQFCG